MFDFKKFFIFIIWVSCVGWMGGKFIYNERKCDGVDKYYKYDWSSEWCEECYVFKMIVENNKSKICYY